MAWYDNVKSNIKVDSYSPTDTRTKDAQSEGLELQNQNTQYASQQKRNMDQAFADTMEQKIKERPYFAIWIFKLTKAICLQSAEKAVRGKRHS